MDFLSKEELKVWDEWMEKNKKKVTYKIIKSQKEIIELKKQEQQRLERLERLEDNRGPNL